MNKYYVYALCYPDGEPFYIGKGQGKRIDDHEKEVKRKQKINPYKQAIIKQIQQTGQYINKQKIAEFACELDAYMYEWAIINMSTYSEKLTNMQHSTFKYTEAHKKAKLLTAQFPEKPEKAEDHSLREATVLINKALNLDRSIDWVRQLIVKGKLTATQAAKASPYQIKQEAIDAFLQTYKFQTKHSHTRKEHDSSMTNYISISESARKLDVHPTTLLRAIKAGELEAVKLGKQYRVTEQALQDYVDRKTIKVGGIADGHQSA